MNTAFFKILIKYDDRKIQVPNVGLLDQTCGRLDREVG